VRLPAEFRFEGNEVFIHRDPATGDVILSRKPEDWDGFLEAIKGLKVPEGFLSKAERKQRQEEEVEKVLNDQTDLFRIAEHY
jgi:antitoxin VapB